MLEDFLQKDFLHEAFFLEGLFVAWPCNLAYFMLISNFEIIFISDIVSISL